MPVPNAALCPQGRFTIAAKHHISIAEIYESELVDIEKVSTEGSFHPNHRRVRRSCDLQGPFQSTMVGFHGSVICKDLSSPPLWRSVVPCSVRTLPAQPTL